MQLISNDVTYEIISDNSVKCIHLYNLETTYMIYYLYKICLYTTCSILVNIFNSG